MFDFWGEKPSPAVYASMLPRVVGCKKCGKKFTLRKKQMYFHCGTMVILLVKESMQLTDAGGSS